MVGVVIVHCVVLSARVIAAADIAAMLSVNGCPGVHGTTLGHPTDTLTRSNTDQGFRRDRWKPFANSPLVGQLPFRRMRC